MARDVSEAQKTQLDSDALSPCLFIQFQFSDGNLNLWTGYNQIVFNGEIYIGAGNVLVVDRVAESQELTANSVSFGLNGLNSGLISAALTSNYQGRAAIMWFGVLGDNRSIIGTYQLFKGRMDVISFTDNGETADFVIKCESNMIDIRKARERRFTPQDQKIDYPDDQGLDFIPKIQDITINWGRGK